MSEPQVVTIALNSTGDDPTIDTFDNPVVESPKVAESNTVEATEKLEVQTDENEKAEKKDEPKDKKETKDDDKEKPKVSDDADKKPAFKKGIKALDGEDSYELNPDMQIRLKVGNKYEMVPLKQISETYGDALDIADKQETFQQEAIQYRQEKKEYESEKAEITEHFKKIGNLLDDPEANPIDALNYLLDLTGRNRYEFNKKILEKQLEELDTLQSMDEVERAKYFLEKENAYLKEKQEISRTSMKSKLDTENFIKQVTEKREAQGVSEEQFNVAYNDLLELGEKEGGITPDQVIDYAVSLPAVVRAEGLLKDYDSELVNDDELVLQLAGYLRENPTTPDEEIMQRLKEELGSPKEVKKLNKKYEDPYGRQDNRTKESSDKLDTFDDEYVYGRV